MAIDDFNERMYGSAYGDTAHVTRIADVWLQNILATANVPLADQARIAGILAADPTAQGEQAAYDEILTLAGLENEDKYRSKCTKWADSMLKKIFAYISNQYLYDQTQTDGDGIQVFQVDFVDNFDGFLMSGWAFGTDSNRSHCPECAQALQPQDRHGRLCPTCNADLRTNSAIMTCIPWKHVAGFSPFTAISLKQKRDKYMVVSLMEGACPEVLVAHEMGHHLFMPHAPQGFAIPNPLPNTLVWRFLSFVFTRPTIAAQIAAATNTTGSHGPYHSTHNNACIMGYNFAEMPQLHFCYKCTLRLKGWSGAIVSALP
jgi:hypothetical protein